MNGEKYLALEITTKSGSTYNIYKYDDIYILKSSSKAFDGADFIVFQSLFINERINFNGKIYFNAQLELYEKKYRIIPRNKQKKVISSSLDSIQKTTRIEKIEIKNNKILKSLLKLKVVSIDEKYLQEYKLD